jgi:hypothetical protein
MPCSSATSFHVGSNLAMSDADAIADRMNFRSLISLLSAEEVEGSEGGAIFFVVGLKKILTDLLAGCMVER